MIAAIDLGIPWGDIGRLTPALILQMFERRQRIERRQDLRFGLLASLYLNAHRKKGRSPVSPDHFFPELGSAGGPAARPVRWATPEEMKAKFLAFGHYVQKRGLGSFVQA